MYECENMTSEMAYQEAVLESVEEVGAVVDEIFGDTFADMGTDLGAAFGDVLAGDADIADLPIPKIIDIWKVISVQLANYTIITSYEWEDTYKDYYARNSVKMQTLLSRVIGNAYSITAKENPDLFGDFEFIGIELAGWEKEEISGNLAVKMYGSFTYAKRINLLEADLSQLGSELDFSWIDDRGPIFRDKIREKTIKWSIDKQFANVTFNNENEKQAADEFNRLFLVLDAYQWEVEVLGFEQYKARNDYLKKQIKREGDVPEMLAYVQECTSCYVLPVQPVEFAQDFVMPPQRPMMNSLSGVGAIIDLCKAKNKKLFEQINAQGRPPFQGTVFGIPADFVPLVAIIINDQEPYDTSVGILDTELWAEFGPDTIYLELRDADDLAGNVTVKITRSVCDKAAAVDAEVSARQNLKPAQVSFILDGADFNIQTIKTLTEKMYSTFNGLGSVKSIEFIGRRNMTGQEDQTTAREALAEREVV